MHEVFVLRARKDLFCICVCVLLNRSNFLFVSVTHSTIPCSPFPTSRPPPPHLTQSIHCAIAIFSSLLDVRVSLNDFPCTVAHTTHARYDLSVTSRYRPRPFSSLSHCINSARKLYFFHPLYIFFFLYYHYFFSFLVSFFDLLFLLRLLIPHSEEYTYVFVTLPNCNRLLQSGSHIQVLFCFTDVIIYTYQNSYPLIF